MKNLLVPVKDEVMDAKRYLKTISEKRSNIESVTFVPPAIGDGKFGAFKVTYRLAELRQTHVGAK